MEKYFKVIKRSAAHLDSDLKHVKAEDGTDKTLKSSRNIFHPHSKSSLNKTLLETLGDETNPITHSDLADRSDKVISTTTGHQIAEDVASRKHYFNERSAALQNQHKPSESTAPATGIFRNTRVYINGYLEGTTDIEIKRLVIEGGGKVLFTPSRSTHILTSTGLNGSKTEKYLKSLTNKPYVVKPEWVLESVQSNRRQSERHYVVKMDQTSRQFMSGQ